MKTNFLQLTKPVAGATNWGTAINQNWDTIDRGYGQIRNNLRALESRMTDIGTFSSLQVTLTDKTVIELDYFLLTTVYYLYKDNYYKSTQLHYKTEIIDEIEIKTWYIKHSESNIVDKQTALKYTSGSGVIGRLNYGRFERAQDIASLDEIYSEYTLEYYNDDNTNHALLASLTDYTAFYIQLPTILDNEDQSLDTVRYAFGLDWTEGEIFIKSSQVVDNRRRTIIKKFKQALGGYYVPSSKIDNANTIIFTKQQSAASEPEYVIDIPRCIFNNAWTRIQLEYDSIKSNYFHKINWAAATEYNGIKYYRRLVYIQFWVLENGTYKPIYVDHTVTYGTTVAITTTNNVLPTPPEDGASVFYVSYAVTEFSENDSTGEV